MDVDDDDGVKIFWNEVERQRLICSECLNLLFPPKQLGCCGVRICGKCAERKLEGLLECPDQTCKTINPKVLPDRGYEREMLKQSIRCPICSDEKIYPFKDLLTHLDQNHQYECTYCHEKLHLPEARTRHEDQFCERRPMSCPLAEIGCTEKFLFSELENHCRAPNHQMVVTNFCKEEVLARSSKNSRKRQRKLSREEEKMQLALALEELNSVMEQVHNLESQSTTLKTGRTTIEKRLERCRTQLKDNYGLYENSSKNVDAIGKTFQQIRECLHQVDMKLSSICRLLDLNNNFTWIVALPDLLNGDAEIRSEPFQTSANGYRMELRVRVSPKGKSTLSVTLAFLPGAFDAILRWPFRYSMTISLINLKNPLKTVSHAVKGNFSSKPTDQMKSSFIIPAFCSLETINAKDSGYKEDKSIFFQYHCDFSLTT